MVFLRVGREDVRHAGIEPAPQKGGQPGRRETVVVLPLGAVFEFGLIRVFVVRRVQIMDPPFPGRRP